MKVLGINGSPRVGGNSDILLHEALEGARTEAAEIEEISVFNMRISGCREIYTCLKDGNCAIRDDMDGLYPKLWTADRVIIAAPMFFYGVPAQLKAMIDRCQALWARKYVLKRESPVKGRRGAFIGVGATHGKNLFEGSILTIKYFFKAIDVEYADQFLVRGIDKIGEIKDHPEALKEAFELGRRLVHPEAH